MGSLLSAMAGRAKGIVVRALTTTETTTDRLRPPSSVAVKVNPTTTGSVNVGAAQVVVSAAGVPKSPPASDTQV